MSYKLPFLTKQESFPNLKKICTEFFCPPNKSSYPKFLFCYPLANNEFLSFIGPLWLHLWLTIQATRGKVSGCCICLDEFPVCWVVGLLHSATESSLTCFWPKLMSHLPSSRVTYRLTKKPSIKKVEPLQWIFYVPAHQETEPPCQGNDIEGWMKDNSEFNSGEAQMKLNPI